MSKRWRIQQHDTDRISSIVATTDVSPVVAQLLASRGITDPTQILDFLDGKLTGLRDTADLPGVPAATDCILAAMQAEK